MSFGSCVRNNCVRPFNLHNARSPLKYTITAASWMFTVVSVCMLLLILCLSTHVSLDSGQQQPSSMGAQSHSASDPGPIRATAPMWRCSRIMHMQRELHPTLLSSLEGIVDQMVWFRENWHEEVGYTTNCAMRLVPRERDGCVWAESRYVIDAWCTQMFSTCSGWNKTAEPFSACCVFGWDENRSFQNV